MSINSYRKKEIRGSDPSRLLFLRLKLPQTREAPYIYIYIYIYIVYSI